MASINKTNTTICGDTIYLEIDSILPTWSYYCFELPVDTAGTKDIQTIVFRVREAPEPTREPDPHPPSIIKTEVESVANSDGVKFEEEDTIIKKEDSEEQIRVEMEEGDDLAGPYHKCLATPCVHLSRRVGNLDAATRDILRTQKRPWQHIVRPFEASDIPRRLAEREAAREKRRKFEEEYHL